MIWRFIGKTFIGAGVFILLFLGYQLFGTNYIAAQKQVTVAADFEASLSVSSLDDEEPVEPEIGDAIGRIMIDKIGVDWYVVEGVGLDDLRRGPGHIPESVLPGEPGNVVISGHRTTYGAPFFRLDELKVGDEITIETVRGAFSYFVTEKKIVAPTDVAVAGATEDSRLTLTTCNPRFSAAQRLIIVAKPLVDSADAMAA